MSNSTRMISHLFLGIFSHECDFEPSCHQGFILDSHLFPGSFCGEQLVKSNDWNTDHRRCCNCPSNSICPRRVNVDSTRICLKGQRNIRHNAWNNNCLQRKVRSFRPSSLTSFTIYYLLVWYFESIIMMWNASVTDGSHHRIVHNVDVIGTLETETSP